MRGMSGLLAAALVLMCAMTACGATAPEPAPSETLLAPPTVSGTATLAPAVPETVVLPAPAEGWADSYLQFLEGSFDIFSALWPEGVSGMGFIDLDLDGTPELVVFDQGASITLGAHIFDLVDGKVYCVSSALDSAGGAFDGTYLSPADVCTNLFESFRLSRTEEGWCFWVDSSNGTMETTWDEFIRFDCVNGVLTPKAVCYRYLEYDPASGLVAGEEYTVSGAPADRAAYEAAADIYRNGLDAGYEAKGVFLWNGSYDTAAYEGFTALAQAAVAAYSPITDTVTLASAAG